MHGNPGDPNYPHDGGGLGGGGSTKGGGTTAASAGSAGFDSVANVGGEPHYASGKVGTAVGSGKPVAEYENADGTSRVWLDSGGRQSGDGESKKESLTRSAASKTASRVAVAGRIADIVAGKSPAIRIRTMDASAPISRRGR